MNINLAAQESWKKIAPTWPLRNLIAANPLAGFEDLPFEEALAHAQAYFQQTDMPEPMQEVNRQSIKWLQAYFDQGQATIKMPLREQGLLKSIINLMPYDKILFNLNKNSSEWLSLLPDSADEVIACCLKFLEIPAGSEQEFLSLMLTTLPGWAAYLQYRVNWADQADLDHPHRVSQQDYLALRLILTSLLYPKARELLNWHEKALLSADPAPIIARLKNAEIEYEKVLLEKLSSNTPKTSGAPKAQFVFCIDVRSEPFRRALEAQGPYETFGFAGFFGLPISVENTVTKECHASCPVLLSPQYQVELKPSAKDKRVQACFDRVQAIKRLYQSMKYNFVSPLALVETMGLTAGALMTLRNLFPRLSLKQKKSHHVADFQSIPFEVQCQSALGALRLMGLTQEFAPLVIFCGHGAETQNNAYASALDCGACAGRQGGANAKVLAQILNQGTVRAFLKENGIEIPDQTHFMAAQHNTTTDEVEIYDDKVPEGLLNDLKKAKAMNSQRRCQQLGEKLSPSAAAKHTLDRAHDWAQIRPEWGLARNAAFIIAPRVLTSEIDLEGRAFLHSYDWTIDDDGSLLTTIMTAPMVVAQWINSQYLFSTLDNVAFGGGNKITKNITGKIGIMQGNASDLMHGLPLQSVFQSDTLPYHECQRLLVVIHAPRERVERIIQNQPILQKLFGKGWVKLVVVP